MPGITQKAAIMTTYLMTKDGSAGSNWEGVILTFWSSLNVR